MVTDAGIEMSVHGDSSTSWIPVGNGLRERLVKSGNVFPFRLRLSRMPGRRNAISIIGAKARTICRNSSLCDDILPDQAVSAAARKVKGATP